MLPKFDMQCYHSLKSFPLNDVNLNDVVLENIKLYILQNLILNL